MKRASTSKTLLLSLAAVVGMTLGAAAQPALKMEISKDGGGTYKLRTSVSVEIKIENTTSIAGSGNGVTAAEAAAENRANTAYNIRVSKLLLVGTDIYGNPVTIANQDLSFAVPNGSSSVGPQRELIRTLRFNIPDDGTLHDASEPGYRIVVEVSYDLQGGGPGAVLRDSTGSNVLVSVLPNLRLPTMTFPARTDHRGGEVVSFTSFILNNLIGEGTLSGRPLRPNTADEYRLNTYLTTDPQIGGSNNDDFLLSFLDLFGDLGGVAPASTSEIRRIRVVGTPPKLLAYGDPDFPATQRNYTPQPDDGFLDLGETLVIDYEILVPENYRGLYFVGGFVDSLNNLGEPPAPRESGAAAPSDNHYVSAPAVRFGIQATASPDLDLVSGVLDPSTGSLARASDDASDLPAVSRRGEVVAFASYASNLDTTGLVTNGRRHIYARITNLRTGAVTTRLVSRSSANSLANNDCTDPAVSSNGRFITYSSTASNLVEKDSAGFSDIFVHDLLLGTTSRVSLTGAGLQANGASFSPSISGDGRFVAFHSRATNLRPAGTLSGGGVTQVFVVDRDKDKNGVFDEIASDKIGTYLASVNKGGQRGDSTSYLARISADGNFLVYVSNATNLDSAASKTASGQGKYGIRPFSSIYRIGLNNGAPILSSLDVVSVPDAATMPGFVTDATSYELAINADGKHIAFTSQGTNLVPGDTNGVGDVFVRDYSGTAPKTVRVSTSAERSATGTLTILGAIGGLLPPGNRPTDNAQAGDQLTIDDGSSPLPPLFTAGGNWAIGANASITRDNLVRAINNAGLTIQARASTPAIPITKFLSTSTSFAPSIELYNAMPGEQGNTAAFMPLPGPASVLFSGMDGGGTQANDPDQDVNTPSEDLVGVPSGSNMPSIDASGRYVAFRSVAVNLDVYKFNPDDAVPAPRNVLRDGELIRPLSNFSSNVYVHDRCVDGRDDGNGNLVFDDQGNSAATRVSVNKFGYRTLFLLNSWSSANSHSPAISGNGLRVAFSSDAENNSGIIFGRNNQSPLDNNARRDVFSYVRGDVGDEADAGDQLSAQVIAFEPLPSPIVFDTSRSLTLKANATSALPITFTSSNPRVATASGSTLTIHTAGTTVVTARQVGNAEWEPADNVSQTLVINKGQQVINFTEPAPVPSGASRSFPLVVSVNSGLPLTFKTQNPNIATVSQEGIVTVLENASGKTLIEVSQAGDANWDAAATVLIPIESTQLLRPDIVFNLTTAQRSQQVTNPRAELTLSATSTYKGTPVYFVSSNPRVVAINGNVATMLAPGTVDIFARQDSTSASEAPAAVKQTIVVSKGAPGALKDLPAVEFGKVTELTLETTDAFGRAITHTSSNPSVASVTGSKLRIIAAGNATVRSRVIADANVTGLDVTRKLIVGQGSQKIAWNAPTTMIDGTIKASPAPARTTGGVVITYTSSNPSVVRASGNSITIVGKGFATVTATAAANSNYQAAAPVAYRVGRPY